MTPRRLALAFMDPPLPFGNAASRWYYVLLRELVNRGHRVTAFCGYRRPAELEEACDLFPARYYDLRCFRSVPDAHWSGRLGALRQPFSYPFTRDYRASLCAELARGIDVLHLEQVWGGWPGWDYADRSLLHIHYAYALDQSAAAPGSLKERVVRARAVSAERRILRRFRYISALSPRLRRFAEQANPSARTFTVPLGMDLNLYPYQDPEVRPAPVLGLIGSFNWTPSYLAGHRLLTRLWPEIHRRVPECRLLLAGRSARSAFADFLHLPSLDVEEDVPDILPCFRRLSALAYAPQVGTGMKVKVLEAFALGVPVITNPEGIEGLDAQDGEHVFLAADDARLIERAVQLLTQPDQARHLARSARRLVESTCGVSSTVDGMESIHHEICLAMGHRKSAVAA